MIRVTWQQLEERARERPAGYHEDVLRRARDRDSEGFSLALGDIEALRAKWMPPTPSWVDLIFRFSSATAQWAAAGFPVVSGDVFKARLRSCRACPWWKRWRCTQCGCAGVKLWLATEQCPLPENEKRWRAII